ncbi:46 kDa FK506-binding nuclear protein [Ischnura elegans]|uniref:46 kDa FK506-binding nuclear protein n=1 Tax=Ischnura elegans TaxID=197161 RepID=UPI001ED8893B|nr:46 kDa FK506-binding nuclear protein [Ischnura elegans]
MFWALVIEPNKRYTQVVSKSFHVSMACMDLETGDNEVTSVMLEVGDEKLILCNLSKNKYIQQALDLNFQIGDEISFYSKGKASIHLTGYLIIGDDFPGMMSDQESEDDEEEDEEEEEDAKERLKILASKAMKRGIEEKSSKNKKPKLDSSVGEEDSDEDDEDFEIDEESSEEEESAEDDSQLMAGGDSSDSEDESSDDAMEVAVDSKKKKKGKPQQQQPTPKGDMQKGKGKEGKKEEAKGATPMNKGDKKATEALNGTPTLSAKKKKQLKEGGGTTPNQPKAKGESTPKAEEMQKKTLPGGVAIEDLKIGNGPAAKPGRMVTVYYVGRLKHNNKQFDSTQQGPGFKFRLGSNEVIKGWDLGVSGMKVGGKRKIVCPPNMAYGSKGSPPVIPPNSSLVFEVELKNVN